MFQLKTIRHGATKNEKRPLCVSFTFAGKAYSVECRASELATFARFRNVAADRLGVWLDSDDYIGRRGREDWNLDVTAAFDQGKKA
jgi:hypothetical protein